MLDNSQTEVKSPCIGVCTINEVSLLCQGCYRTIDEIKAWWDMSQSEQSDLLLKLVERQQQVNFD
jgi:predicted Fe-S protein YdhL (DUF1289 family)